MQKLIPYRKLSMKEQKKLNALRRSGWGGLNPVTRRPENPKAYNRAKERSWKKDSSAPFLNTAGAVSFDTAPGKTDDFTALPDRRYPARS